VIQAEDEALIRKTTAGAYLKSLFAQSPVEVEYHWNEGKPHHLDPDQDAFKRYVNASWDQPTRVYDYTEIMKHVAEDRVTLGEPWPFDVGQKEYVDTNIRRLAEVLMESQLLDAELRGALGYDPAMAKDFPIIHQTDGPVANEKARRRAQKLPPMTKKDELSFRKQVFREVAVQQARQDFGRKFEEQWYKANKKCLLIMCWT
jgi:hypothetical protein